MHLVDSYFKAPLDLYNNWKSNSVEKNILDIFFILSYLTVAIPGIVYLIGRCKPREPKPIDHYLAKHILKHNLPFEEIERKAEKGCPQCQMKMGLDYFVGQNVRRDDLEGKKWFEKAAERGYLPAIQKVLCAASDRYHLDEERWLYWIKKAAHLNDPFRQFQLGQYYEQGRYGLEKDMKQARYWYEKAAALGEKDAIKRLEELFL